MSGDEQGHAGEAHVRTDPACVSHNGRTPVASRGISCRTCAHPAHHCGGRVIPETRRGVTHLICQSCNKCDECDAAGRKTYGPHRGEVPS